MAVRQHEARIVDGRADGPSRHAGGPVHRAREEASSLKVLLRQLGEDRQPRAVHGEPGAQGEMRREARAIASDLVQAAAALGMAMLGAFALTAFLILVVGQLLGDAFWAGALIVGGLFLVIGGLWARSALAGLKEHDLKPRQTMETLREDQRWAKQEARDFKREVSS